ncbi:hypothetical protein ACHWQZ_G006912 [Mnemiopsis leidyi]
MTFERLYVLLLILPIVTSKHRVRNGFYKRVLSFADKGAANLGFHIKESARRSAFEKVWEEVQEDIQSGDIDSGLGLFPDVGLAFPTDNETEKMRRYRENFVPAYNTVIFLPRHPVVTGINFFALLSEEEKKMYLGADVTNHTIRTILEDLAPEDLKQYDLEQMEGYNGKKEAYFHNKLHTLAGLSEQYVNFTHAQQGIEARSSGAYQTAGIFSAIKALESVYSLKTIFTGSRRKQFSRQFLVDCLQEEGQSDKVKWFPHQVFSLLQNTQYMPEESYLAYTGTSNNCKDDKALPNGMANAVKVVGSEARLRSEGEMLDHFKGSGPVSVCIHVNDHIFYYQSGLSNECVAGVHCNHFVTLMAYNKLFFTVENFWGKRWGMQGRMNMLRMNCVDNPEGSRFLVTSVTLTIQQEEEEEVKEVQEVEEVEEEEGTEAVMVEAEVGSKINQSPVYVDLMFRENLIINKDYSFIKKIHIGDVIVLKAKSILDYSKDGIHHVYLSLLETESDVNIPYHIMLDLQHRAVVQTYYFGHQHAQFPKLIERVHRDEIDVEETVIWVHFTRTHIQTRVNDKVLRPFYHQADIKTIGSCEVHGPEGWFKSIKHLRPVNS